MKQLALVLFVLTGCIVGDHRESAEEQSSDNWGVYDPQPGHPTLDERDRFVAEVGRYAQEAEATYGVPAAALTAMACNESGFGWTRIALYANNLFGWKYTTASAAGGRPAWELVGQPEWDDNNLYVHFADRRDAVLFVASKLANNARYKPHTERYLADLAAGVDAGTAANKWVYGIAYAGYNPFEHYPVTTINFMRNYRSPGPTISPTYNLYKLSPVGRDSWISFDSPAANATVGGDVTLASSVGGPGITSVVFSSRAKGATSWYRIGEDAAPPFTLPWATASWVPNGTYELKAEAWAGGMLRATGVITVTVAN